MKKNIFYKNITLILASLFSMQVYAAVSISEIMPCNISTLLNESDNFTGWVEFYNDGTESYNLKGATITQYKKKGSLKWSWTIDYDFKISAGKYAVIFFDKTPSDPSQPQQSKHSCYKVDSDGGTLTLECADGTTSEIVYSQMVPHLSFGLKDGVQGYMEPTPEAKNSTAYADLSASRCAKPTFSTLKPGVYDKIDHEVVIQSNESDAEIRYTTNGSEPTSSSTLYEGPISINATAVVRACAFKDGKLPSEILTGSFIDFGDKHSQSCWNQDGNAPANNSLVVSITAKKDYFYGDELGIYVVGTNGVEGEKDCVKSRANYNQDWNRPVNLEYFVNGTLMINQEAEVAVMGGCSRKSDNSVKSLKITTNKKTGAETYGYNPYSSEKEKQGNEYASFQLRNGGNAYGSSEIRVRDAFMQSIAIDMGNVDYQAYQPVGFYLNGSYKGLMGLRERTNKEYVFSNYGYDEDEIDVVELTESIVASSGDLEAYDEMIEYASNNYDASNYVAKMNNYLDLDEYLNYMIFEQFIVNTDWPGNNCKFWRQRAGGKFRCILYDTDFGFGLYGASALNYCDVNNNMIEWCMGTGSRVNWANGDRSTNSYTSESRWKTILFGSLMQNDEFKQMYLTKSLIHLANALSYENVKAKWDDIVNRAKVEYCATFTKNLADEGDGFKSFAKKRVDVVYSQLAELYNLDNELVDLTLKCSNSNASFVVNKVNTDSHNYTLSCLKGMSVILSADLPDGYDVKSWKVGSDTYTTPTVALTMNEATSVTLTIEESNYDIPAIFINEVCAKNTLLKDEDTDSKPDWIELYNASDKDVDVAGFYLSDNASNPTMSKIASGYTTTIIPAKGYLLLWADGESTYGPLHVDFKLSDTQGETITLCKVVRDSLLRIDSFTFPSVGENASYGRTTDGAKTFTTFDVCLDGEISSSSPGKTNGSVDCDAIIKANFVDLTIESNYNYINYTIGTSNYSGTPFVHNAFKGRSVTIEPQLSDNYFSYWKSSVPFAYEKEILSSTTEWSYFYGEKEPSGNWTSVSYNDADWLKGAGRFGFSNDKRTYDVTMDYGESDDKYLTSYFRTTFNYSSNDVIDTLMLNLTYDDGAVVYLNGKEIARYNMPDSTPTYKTCTKDYLDDATAKIVIKASQLTVGENCLAVEIHQCNATTSDLTFAMSAVAKGFTYLLYDKVLTFTPTESMTLKLFTSEVTVANELEQETNQLQLYPNPADEYVYLRSTESVITSVSLLNTLGKPIMRCYPMTETYEMDLSEVQTGCYTLIVNTLEKQYVRKLMVK